MLVRKNFVVPMIIFLYFFFFRVQCDQVFRLTNLPTRDTSFSPLTFILFFLLGHCCSLLRLESQRLQRLPTLLIRSALVLVLLQFVICPNICSSFSLGVTFAILTNLCHYLIVKCRSRSGSHFQRFAPVYLVLISIPLIMADLFR